MVATGKGCGPEMVLLRRTGRGGAGFRAGTGGGGRRVAGDEGVVGVAGEEGTDEGWESVLRGGGGARTRFGGGPKWETSGRLEMGRATIDSRREEDSCPGI